MYTKEEYEEKRNARYERLLAAAAKAEKESHALLDRAHKMAEVIPFGQPILVGHHSEGRDRRYRAKIEGTYRKGFELMDKIGYYKSRASAIEHNHAIMSDDPDAVSKLGDKLAQLEARQKLMVAANKFFRKGDTPDSRKGLQDLGFEDKIIDELFKPDFVGRIGYAAYELQNNNASIARLKKRVKRVEKMQSLEDEVWQGANARFELSYSENRVRLFYRGKPADDVRTDLKRHGFRWTPSMGCWQAYPNYTSTEAAKRLAGEQVTA